MEFKDLVELQKEFDKKHQSTFNWSVPIDESNLDVLAFLLISLIGEVGEASNIVKKIIRGDFSFNEKKSALSEEFADVMIYLFKIAYQLNIDLEKEYLKKLEINKERFKIFEEVNKC